MNNWQRRIRRTTHPCYFGTLYQSEREALAGRVPKAVRAWLDAVAAARSLGT
ncbi:hypothetical protein [Pseudomonas oryzihabitans]|uniref:hypothetical protein n=1 Tax=Pseudomonas oryzihabitans TaxID=47885 RepID=UPI001642E591|nr:hypothetical protein [Pseudomonas oryzihabitans]